MIAVLPREDPNHVPRITMIRLDLEYLPISGLGLGQPTRLVMLDRNGQCFGNWEHRSISLSQRMIRMTDSRSERHRPMSVAIRLGGLVPGTMTRSPGKS